MKKAVKKRNYQFICNLHLNERQAMNILESTFPQESSINEWQDNQSQNTPHQHIYKIIVPGLATLDHIVRALYIFYTQIQHGAVEIIGDKLKLSIGMNVTEVLGDNLKLKI
jgi:hypothetical protein